MSGSSRSKPASLSLAVGAAVVALAIVPGAAPRPALVAAVSPTAAQVTKAQLAIGRIPRSAFAPGRRPVVLRAAKAAARAVRSGSPCAGLRGVSRLSSLLRTPTTWRHRRPPKLRLAQPLALLNRSARQLLLRAGARCARLPAVRVMKAQQASSADYTPVPPLSDENDQGEGTIKPTPLGTFRPVAKTGGGVSPSPDPHGQTHDSVRPQRRVTAGAVHAAADALAFFRSSDAGVPGRTGSPMEPTAAIGGNVVWFTGNSSVALSTNAGRTFTGFNPSDIVPDDGLGFCCDQIVSYSPSYNLFVWVMQYWCQSSCLKADPTDSTGKRQICPTGAQTNGSNRIRIAVASPESLVKYAATPKDAWTWWDFTPQFFGQPANAWFDRSDFGLNSVYANWSVDVICGTTSAVDARISLADLARRATVGIGWITDSAGRVSVAQGTSTSTTYFAATNSLSQERIWSWDAYSNTLFRHDVDHSTVPIYNAQDTGSDSNDWHDRYGIFPGAVDSATVSGTTLYTAHGTGRDYCTANCSGTSPTYQHVFDQPAILVDRYDVNTWRLIGERWLWNPTLAFTWPALDTDGNGDVGIAFRSDTSGHNARPVAGFLTPDEQFTFALPEGMPHETGDYYALRPGRTPESFVMTGQTVQNDGAGPAMHWNFIEYGHGPAPYVGPPTVRITAPANLSTFTAGTAVTYTADATDAVDGALPAGAIVWREDGVQIGTGPVLAHQESAVGSHTIQVTATNGDGKSASAQITIRVQAVLPPGAPVVSISSPVDGQYFCVNRESVFGHYYEVSFQASAVDPGGLPLTYEWTDSVDGGTAFAISSDLSPSLRLYQTDSQQQTVHDLTLTASNGTTAASRSVRVNIMNPDFCIR